jgi:hypothetical protein
VWTHVAVVWGANRVHTNGVLAVDGADSDLGAGALHMYIGDRFALADQSFDGSIDDVRVYNRALSSNDVARIYQGLKPLHD